VRQGLATIGRLVLGAVAAARAQRGWTTLSVKALAQQRLRSGEHAMRHYGRPAERPGAQPEMLGVGGRACHLRRGAGPASRAENTRLAERGTTCDPPAAALSYLRHQALLPLFQAHEERLGVACTGAWAGANPCANTVAGHTRQSIAGTPGARYRTRCPHRKQM